MSDGFMESLFAEAGRLFGVSVTRLFNRGSIDHSVAKRDAEHAIGYALWVIHAERSLEAHIGYERDVRSLVTLCIRRRRQDARNDRLVGELVWFALNWARKAAA